MPSSYYELPNTGLVAHDWQPVRISWTNLLINRLLARYALRTSEHWANIVSTEAALNNWRKAVHMAWAPNQQESSEFCTENFAN